MSFYGFLNLPWWGYIIATLVLTHITMISVTVYLHRASAHRSLDLHPIAAHFFRFWLWLTTGMKTKEWVAVHRKHHVYSDKKDDPHSPVVEGVSTVMWRGTELYRRAKKDPKTLNQYGKGTPNDWLERHVYSTPFLRGKLGVLLMLIADILLFGGPGIIIWGLQMAWTPFFAAGVINGIGHSFGYRNFECRDAARNILPWGILIAGEELHNNHHAYGTSAKLSVKWWEFDIGWMYIKLLRLFGLAKVRQLFPKRVLEKSKQHVDTEALRAIFSNRLQLLSDYSKRVIKPVLKHEKKKFKIRNKPRYALTRKLRRSMIKDKAHVNEIELACMNVAFKHSKRLETLHHYCHRLHDLWNEKTLNQKEKLKALQDWCNEAERSSIKALRDFVEHVKAFKLQQTPQFA